MDDSISSSFYSSEDFSIESEELTGGVCRKGKRGEPKIKSSIYTIKRRKEGIMEKIYLFNTAECRNSILINAVTGMPYHEEGVKFTVGSVHEDSIFKVKFVTRERNIPGLLLCYDSPEQYERHTCSTLHENIKRSWEEKNLHYRYR